MIKQQILTLKIRNTLDTYKDRNGNRVYICFGDYVFVSLQFFLSIKVKYEPLQRVYCALIRSCVI